MPAAGLDAGFREAKPFFRRALPLGDGDKGRIYGDPRSHITDSAVVANYPQEYRAWRGASAGTKHFFGS